jgi:hypothetical protein
MSIDYKKRATFLLEGLKKLENAFADKILGSQFDSDYTRDYIDISKEDEQFLAEMKQYDIDFLIDEYRAFLKKVYINDGEPVYNAEAAAKLSSLIIGASECLQIYIKDPSLPLCYYDIMLGLCDTKNISQENLKCLYDVNLLCLSGYGRGVYIDINTGNSYREDVLFSRDNRFYKPQYHLINAPKVYIYSDADGEYVALIPKDVKPIDITSEHIKKINLLGETDYRLALSSSKSSITRAFDVSYTLIKILNISYEKVHSDDYDGPKYAIITDENGCQITIHNEFDVHSENYFTNIFYRVKSSDLIGSSIFLSFYISGEKIYAKPLTVITDEKIIHFRSRKEAI